MSLLVDTKFLSELARPRPDETVVEWLRRNEPNLYVSAITIGELRRGIDSLAAGARRTSLQKWLTGLCDRMEGRVLSFNLATAHVWDQLVARWAKSGQAVPAIDSQVAGAVSISRLTLTTRKVARCKALGARPLHPTERLKPLQPGH